MSYYEHPDDRSGGMATMADAHAEWHRNTGIPMGTPGCPMDACHGEPDWDEPDTLTARETIIQSAAIHPDWTAEDHASYLRFDAYLVSEDAEIVHSLPLEVLTHKVAATLAAFVR